MDCLYKAFMEEMDYIDNEEDILMLSNDIRNNYIRMIELIINEENDKY